MQQFQTKAALGSSKIVLDQRIHIAEIQDRRQGLQPSRSVRLSAMRTCVARYCRLLVRTIDVLWNDRAGGRSHSLVEYAPQACRRSSGRTRGTTVTAPYCRIETRVGGRHCHQKTYPQTEAGEYIAQRNTNVRAVPPCLWPFRNSNTIETCRDEDTSLRPREQRRC